MTPGSSDRQKPKREAKILVFSDIFVFMDNSEMKKKGKKEYHVWPNELVYVRQPQGSTAQGAAFLEVIGPWRRFIFNCVSTDVLELWKQTLIQAIDARLKDLGPTSLSEFIELASFNVDQAFPSLKEFQRTLRLYEPASLSSTAGGCTLEPGKQEWRVINSYPILLLSDAWNRDMGI